MMDWKAEYQKKLVSVEDAAAVIKSTMTEFGILPAARLLWI
jgi:hypothetical protein